MTEDDMIAAHLVVCAVQWSSAIELYCLHVLRSNAMQALLLEHVSNGILEMRW